MKTPRSCLLLLAVVLAGCSTPGPQSRTRSIFNGRDLTGWAIVHGGEWKVEQGELVGRNGIDWTTNPEKTSSWLRTEKEYGDFTLELEYALNEGGNSGVFIRSAPEKNPAFTGHEMQILDDHGRPPTRHSIGSLYDVIAPTKNLSKPPGEWNQVRIVTRGPRIQITWNGEATMDYATDRLTKGFIGLQNHDHHAVVRYRNLRISEP